MSTSVKCCHLRPRSVHGGWIHRYSRSARRARFCHRTRHRLVRRRPAVDNAPGPATRAKPSHLVTGPCDPVLCDGSANEPDVGSGSSSCRSAGDGRCATMLGRPERSGEPCGADTGGGRLARCVCHGEQAVRRRPSHHRGRWRPLQRVRLRALKRGMAISWRFCRSQPGG